MTYFGAFAILGWFAISIVSLPAAAIFAAGLAAYHIAHQGADQ